MPVKTLIDGFLGFREGYFVEDCALYESLGRDGQKPKALVIACADSRVSPDTVLKTEPGDIFVVRSVANLVPPSGGPDVVDSTSAALEYGVKALKVEHVIVMGHSQCGGIHALLDGAPDFPHVEAWVSSHEPAARRVRETLGSAPKETQARACEQAAALTSIENLMTYPWIAERVEAGTLRLHAWYFDMKEGALWAFDPSQNTYLRIDGQ